MRTPPAGTDEPRYTVALDKRVVAAVPHGTKQLEPTGPGWSLLACSPQLPSSREPQSAAAVSLSLPYAAVCSLQLP